MSLLTLLPLAATGLRFANPGWFTALALIPAAVWLRGRGRLPVLIVPFSAAWHRPSALGSSRWPLVLATAGLVLVVAALARPQRTEDRREVQHEGYDIMMCIDLSTSMLSEDYERNGQAINRLDAIRPVIQAFIEKRPDDRIGIVLFSGKAYTLSSLTLDHDWISRQLERVQIGLIEDGTAIGDGLGVALTRLDQAKHESNGRRQGAFIVLLTDGANNRGTLAPMQAAAIAKARNIPIYTIGAGRDGIVPVPVFDQGRRVGTQHQMADLDEGALRDLANETGGQFFRAAEVGTVESSFRAIDQSQKIEFQARTFLTTTELFPWLAGPALTFWAIGALLLFL